MSTLRVVADAVAKLTQRIRQLEVREHPGAAGDPDAIHDNVAGEIAAIAPKVAPIATDLLVIEDSAVGNVKKSLQIGNLPGGADPNAIHVNVANEISGIAEKVAPANTDVLVIEDSAAGDVKKKVQIVNLPGGADPNAIHVNAANEISGIAPKVAPTAADLIVIEDSAAGNVKKSVQVGNLPGNAANWMWHTFIFTMEGILTLGASPLRIYVPGDFIIDRVYISVDTAPTGQAIIIDVNKNGVTIFTVQANRPEIAALANTGNSGVPDITALALNDYLTFDRDQIGNPVAGSDLTVHVRCQQYLQV